MRITCNSQVSSQKVPRGEAYRLSRSKSFSKAIETFIAGTQPVLGKYLPPSRRAFLSAFGFPGVSSMC
jgi:hypothetical protein